MRSARAHETCYGSIRSTSPVPIDVLRFEM
jgi:hypothetical protein